MTEKSARWWTPARVATAVLSVGALTLAVVPGALSRGTFDPNLAILALTLVGLAWYTCFTYETLEHARETTRLQVERRRISLATGVLGETRMMEAYLRQLVQAGRPFVVDHMEHPILTSALAQLDLFSPNTVAVLLSFETELRVTAEANRHANGLAAGAQQARVLERLLATAKIAVMLVPDVIAVLEEEGGTIPPRPPFPTTVQGDRTLPPPSKFGRFDLEKGWVQDPTATGPRGE